VFPDVLKRMLRSTELNKANHRDDERDVFVMLSETAHLTVFTVYTRSMQISKNAPRNI